MTKTMCMPTLFIGHGSPMNAIDNNKWTRTMLTLGQQLPKPKAILCISAHWLTSGTFITSAQYPRMIYDMYGFPPALYDLQYTAPGYPFLAKKIQERIPFIQLDNKDPWGFDHGTWSVLKFLFPAADVPVLQLSVDLGQKGQFHFELGKMLSELRKEGVMIIGSGNIVHNLRAVSMNPDEKPFAWAKEFDEWFKGHLEAENYEPLINDFDATEIGKRSVPTPDHYFPALYSIGARLPNDKLQFHYETIEHGSLAMRAFSFS